jgi:hypothetical protein
MGYDADCTMRLDGCTIRGKAVLEQHELIIRGKDRVVIPINAVTSAVAHNGTLTLHYGTATAVLDIGPAAAKWAKRITHPPSRLDKLGAKPGMSALVTGVRHEDLVDELEARGVIVKRSVRGVVDLIFFGADSREVLGLLRDLRNNLKPAGALWVIRRKGSPAITEAEVMAAGKRAGLVDVKVASFSGTHTAEKFVIPRAAR